MVTPLPALLRSHVQQRWDLFTQHCPETAALLLQESVFVDQYARVWACSDFISQYALSYPQAFLALIQSGDLTRPYDAAMYTAKLRLMLSDIAADQPTRLTQTMRHFRNREMVRIAWRSLSQQASIMDTLAETSALADVCIQQTLALLYQQQTQRYGIPYDSTGHAQPLWVIAVGKLGGSELNFSSDIDLIFCYPQAGETSGGLRSIEHEQFFTQLAQSLIRALNDVTEAGFVFRVDMRLRPYGESGPLVMSLAAMEIYYQEQGREWERYALLKSRVVNPEGDQANSLIALLQRFVYRRYVDYGVIDALRDLKMKMNRETRQRGWEEDIKRGVGGIREAEFVVQALQLIRGGKEPYLQTASFLQALIRLQASDCLQANVVKALRESYIFLRQVENQLQMTTDRQTQQLPVTALEQARLAYALGLASWETMLQHLHTIRTTVRMHFAAMVQPPLQTAELPSKQAQLLPLFSSVWFAECSPTTALQTLQTAGYGADAARVLEQLQLFKKSHRMNWLRSIARKRLDDLMPLLLYEIAQYQHPVVVFERIVVLLEAIVGRSAYLVLLLENPKALHQLIQLCDASAWIAAELARFPLLLDELLDMHALYAPVNIATLTKAIQQSLAFLPHPDFEQKMECLRQFKLAQQLRIAAADIMGKQPVEQVSQALSDLAVVILREAKHMVWQKWVEKSGCPDGGLDEGDFAIIAYGKLGGHELGYGSDLDLVFLHADWENSEFFIRIGQQLMHFLSMRTMAGDLYKLDLRLRPSGDSGLLVTGITAFIEYQQHSAWTWEHQALIRAQVVAGGAKLREQFNALRRTMITQSRLATTLQQHTLTMRERMRSELQPHRGQFDVKQDTGGMTDIEFMVHYLVLLHAHEYPLLADCTDIVGLLQRLLQVNLLEEDAVNALSEAYNAYRSILHRSALQNTIARVADNELLDLREKVTQLWETIFFARV